MQLSLPQMLDLWNMPGLNIILWSNDLMALFRAAFSLTNAKTILQTRPQIWEAHFGLLSQAPAYSLQLTARV